MGFWGEGKEEPALRSALYRGPVWTAWKAHDALLPWSDCWVSAPPARWDDTHDPFLTLPGPHTPPVLVPVSYTHLRAHETS